MGLEPSCDASLLVLRKVHVTSAWLKPCQGRLSCCPHCVLREPQGEITLPHLSLTAPILSLSWPIDLLLLSPAR